MSVWTASGPATHACSRPRLLLARRRAPIVGYRNDKNNNADLVARPESPDAERMRERLAKQQQREAAAEQVGTAHTHLQRTSWSAGRPGGVVVVGVVGGS